MIGLLLCLVHFNSSSAKLVHVNTVELDSDHLGIEELLVDGQGNIYAAYYSDSVVIRFDSSGKINKMIAAGGQGPGEVQNPHGLFMLENHSKLVIVDSTGKWQHFNPDTGNFVSVMNKGLAAVRWVKMDEQHLAGIFAGTDIFFKVIDSNGQLVRAWGTAPVSKPGIITSRYHAFVMGRQGLAYYQQGEAAEIEIYNPNHDGVRIQRLATPKHYREFSKPYDLNRQGFDRAQMKKHMNAFTHLSGLATLSDRYLVVRWAIHQPYDTSIDIYDTTTWKRLVANFVPQGRVFCTKGKQIFFVEERDDEDDVRTLVHMYQLQTTDR